MWMKIGQSWLKKALAEEIVTIIDIAGCAMPLTTHMSHDTQEHTAHLGALPHTMFWHFAACDKHSA